MAPSGFQAASGWQWPDEGRQSTTGSSTSTPHEPEPVHRRRNPAFPATVPERYEPEEAEHDRSAASQPSEGPGQAQPDAGQQQRRGHYRPRTCRICLETVLPTFHPSANLPGIFQSAPNVTYDSDEGRLISPCKCKGSSRYVHEGCLQSWRYADPAFGRRNYWQCPTCGFRYRLERMAWGRFISSGVTQISLTLAIFVLATFALGFVADPIINLYLDPYGTLLPLGEDDGDYPLPTEELPEGWSFHFLKGFASLGVLGFLKFFFASPIRFLNVRVGGGGMGGGRARAGNTGRDRLANVSWVVVALGVATFLYGVWKAVRAWARRTLEKAGDRVVDVQGAGGDDDDEDDVTAPPGSEQ